MTIRRVVAVGNRNWVRNSPLHPAPPPPIGLGMLGSISWGLPILTDEDIHK